MMMMMAAAVAVVFLKVYSFSRLIRINVFIPLSRTTFICESSLLLHKIQIPDEEEDNLKKGKTNQ